MTELSTLERYKQLTKEQLLAPDDDPGMDARLDEMDTLWDALTPEEIDEVVNFIEEQRRGTCR